VNRAQNLLVVSAGGGKLQSLRLVEFCYRIFSCSRMLEILSMLLVWLMASGQFVVTCHGTIQSVCLLNSKGTVVRYYSERISWQMMKMNNPRASAVDKHGNILVVADMYHNRLLVLDSSLSSAHGIHVSVERGLLHPYSLRYVKQSCPWVHFV